MDDHGGDEQENFIPQNEFYNYEEQIMQPQIENADSYSFCLLITCGFSALIGGYFLSGMPGVYGNYSDECKILIQTLKYYSQYLIIDGTAQMIVICIISCCLKQYKKYDLKKAVDKQLLFQFFDQLLIFIVIMVIETIIKDKKSCITVGTNLLIVFYLVLVYTLTFLLSVQIWNL
ncbi:unnamed protein product [Paramecium sonneborni]|uniref:Transmembrane protein n=1 Tax=Paramecium sonneborni TaxID=65129 RepID=A0A8S1M547_9CILI|nr:unnamed protein product [Paramecium sonneborni]